MQRLPSLTASARAFSRSEGVKVLLDTRDEVLRGLGGGGGRRGLGWEGAGVCDVARRTVPGPILGVLCVF
jgi:hypothetical protein